MTDVELLERLLIYQQGRIECMRPSLLGRSGSGKTARVRTAHERLFPGQPFLRIMLSGRPPEDVAGFPRVRGDGMHLIPPVAIARLMREPGTLFLDELDKARPETLPTVLTLLWEKRIEDNVLHPDTRIVVAMQPVEPKEWNSSETGIALSNRLCFIPIAPGWSYVADKLGLGLHAFMKRDAERTLKVPVVPATERAVEWAVTFARENKLPKDDCLQVFCGMMPEADATALWDDMGESHYGMDIPAILKAGHGEKLLDRLTVPEIVECVGDLWEHGTAPLLGKAITRVWIEGSEEHGKRFMALQYERLSTLLDGKTEINVLGESTEEDLVKVMHDATVAIGMVWDPEKVKAMLNEQAKAEKTGKRGKK